MAVAAQHYAGALTRRSGPSGGQKGNLFHPFSFVAIALVSGHRCRPIIINRYRSSVIYINE